MFGIYYDKRLTEKERKILNMHPDDYNWYCVIMRSLFNDDRFFQVRDDIEIPQKEGDNGSVLFFEGGDIVYLKTIDGAITPEEVESILEVCRFLQDKFHCPITAYLPCAPFEKMDVDVEKDGRNIALVFSFIKEGSGEKTIERLENKLKNHEEFTVPDSIDHMLLPYTGYENKEVFYEKLDDYRKLVETYGDC